MLRWTRSTEMPIPANNSDLLAAVAPDEDGESSYLNPELSLLEFQKRVLALAEEPSIPLFERLRFLSIVSANLDVFYMVRDGGIVTSLDPATGRLLKEGRSRGALGGYTASPIAADDKVYLANDEGKITVLKAGGQWEVLGVNDLGDEVHATPALVDGRIYVRTKGAVYCFGLQAPGSGL